MKFVAAIHIKKFVFATNLGLHCVVYIGCVAILYALAMLAAIHTLISQLLCMTVMERR